MRFGWTSSILFFFGRPFPGFLWPASSLCCRNLHRVTNDTEHMSHVSLGTLSFVVDSFSIPLFPPQFNRNNSNNIQTFIYHNLEPTERPLMPTKVLITYHHFLFLARLTYLHLKKKILLIENCGIFGWTL